MPKPLRPCGAAGCPTLVASGVCAEHTRERPRPDADSQPFYNSTRWKAIRATIRAQEPICRECKRRPSATVDHVNGDYRDNRRENLQALCWPCHQKKSGIDHRRKRG